MYSKNEIVKIFRFIKTWDELLCVCELFLYLVDTDPVYKYDQKLRFFISQQSNIAFRRIENLRI